MRKHRAPILCMCLGFDNGYVITGGRDRDVCLWNIAFGPSAALKMTLVGHEAAVIPRRRTCTKVSRLMCMQAGIAFWKDKQNREQGSFRKRTDATQFCCDADLLGINSSLPLACR
jgi:hypothetical protein